MHAFRIWNAQGAPLMRHVDHKELLPELEHFVEGVDFSQPALFSKGFKLDKALEEEVPGTDECHGATEEG